MIRWLGAEHSSTVARKLESGEYALKNETLLDHVVLNVQRDQGKTLQSLGLWPGAELAVRLK